MLAAGKTRITEPLARAGLTLAAMQVSRTERCRRGPGLGPPGHDAALRLHDLPPNTIITDPAPKRRLDGGRVEISGRHAYCGPDHRREVARRRRHANHERQP